MRIEDERELQDLKRKRMDCIDELKSFKKDLQDALHVSVSSSKVLEEKRKNLIEFAFHSKGDNTIKTWNPPELAQLFASFGLLSDIHSQIRLFETVR